MKNNLQKVIDEMCMFNSGQLSPDSINARLVSWANTLEEWWNRHSEDSVYIGLCFRMNTYLMLSGVTAVKDSNNPLESLKYDLEKALFGGTAKPEFYQEQPQ